MLYTNAEKMITTNQFMIVLISVNWFNFTLVILVNLFEIFLIMLLSK